MDKKRLLKLAEVLENPDLMPDGIGFNMHFFSAVNDEEEAKYYPDLTGRDCGTVCCIGGLTCLLWGKDVPLGSSAFHAEGILGLGSSELFYPNAVDDWNTITPAIAAATIRRLAETGDVFWDV